MNIGFLARWLYKLQPTREPDFIIGEPHTYLHRWYVIPRNKWFNIYWHQYWGPDDDRALHDHPWKSLSICLNGALIEQIGTYTVERERVIVEGDVIYRSEKFAHRLYLPKFLQSNPVTLFITWRRVREWGFYCPQGWRDHVKFFGGKDQSENGKKMSTGCGELE